MRSPAPAPWFLALALLSVAPFAGCDREPPPEPPAFLFDSRVPLDPELERLKKGGDDPSKALKPTSAADLGRLLEPGKRFEHVVMPNGTLVVAPRSVDAPGNFWSHPLLASGSAVKTAGHLRIEKSGDALAKVTVDAESDTYCPLPESIRATLAALATLKVPNDILRVESRAVDCWKSKEKPVTGAAPAGPHASFGVVMLDVSRRFELIGRAYKNGRLPLASYALEELEEAFRNDIPITPVPPLPPGASIAPFIDAMNSVTIPALAKAFESKDDKAIVTAYENMAKTCNACHTAAGRAFIEVPTAPGEHVPKIEAK